MHKHMEKKKCVSKLSDRKVGVRYKQQDWRVPGLLLDFSYFWGGWNTLQVSSLGSDNGGRGRKGGLGSSSVV